MCVPMCMPMCMRVCVPMCMRVCMRVCTCACTICMFLEYRVFHSNIKLVRMYISICILFILAHSIYLTISCIHVKVQLYQIAVYKIY